MGYVAARGGTEKNWGGAIAMNEIEFAEFQTTWALPMQNIDLPQIKRFFPPSIRQWNSLQEQVATTESLAQFCQLLTESAE